MKQWKSVDEILDFAIGNEQQAHDFYNDLATKMDRPWMSQIFKNFAKEEMGHKRKLEDVKAGKKWGASDKKALDLKIGDYLVADEPGPQMDYQQALILAMKKEKKAFKLYTNLAETCGDDNLEKLFLALAQEEAKHKLRF
ncbi:MAG: ferritin family protein, partial [Deltaproteobacteria bacterium]|nr:ferritin family protein [Deltaproteobacteria bacterium]